MALMQLGLYAENCFAIVKLLLSLEMQWKPMLKLLLRYAIIMLLLINHDNLTVAKAGANRVILKPIRHAVLKEELLSVLSTT